MAAAKSGFSMKMKYLYYISHKYIQISPVSWLIRFLGMLNLYKSKLSTYVQKKVLKIKDGGPKNGIF